MKSESLLQIQIVNYLSKIARANNFFFHSVPNEGFLIGGRRGGFSMNVNLKKMGLTPGVPDLIILKDGNYYGIEVKSQGGRQSPIQKVVENKILNCGGKYALVRSLREITQILEFWGIIREIKAKP